MVAFTRAALLTLAAQLLLLDPSGAADYPDRPIKFLVGASAGGTTDTMARAIAEPLSAAFGQPVLVENRPGAGGNIAAEAVARAAPDGYMLLVSFTSHTINATLYPKLPFDPVADFSSIAMISTVEKFSWKRGKATGAFKVGERRLAKRLNLIDEWWRGSSVLDRSRGPNHPPGHLAHDDWYRVRAVRQQLLDASQSLRRRRPPQ